MGSTELPGQGLDRSALGVAIEVADQAVAGRPVPRAQYAELVAQLYEALQDGWPVGGLVPYARALADRMLPNAAKRPLPGRGRPQEA